MNGKKDIIENFIFNLNVTYFVEDIRKTAPFFALFKWHEKGLKIPECLHTSPTHCMFWNIP